MAEIKLKAILSAYSKSPLYEDFVRDIYSQSNVMPNTQYVRMYNETNGEYVGEWVPLDTSLLKESLENYEL